MQQLSILGSTGSIGRNTLKIVRRYPDQFRVAALTAKGNVALLAEQIKEFRPQAAAVFNPKLADELQSLLPGDTGVDILWGPEGYAQAAAWPHSDTVVAAMVGAAGLIPTLAAIEAGKNIALANKETLVMAGEIVMDRAAQKGIEIRPVDSEHSAIFQCLKGSRREDLKKILLTGSGGPFRTLGSKDFKRVTVKSALNHPNWSMGPKITIDSATLMNKGLEVIEARWLFGVSADAIEVVIHPQSIVHSMVAYADGSVIAQMGVPDMQGAIAYALSCPQRLDIGMPAPDFVDLGQLTFEAPDLDKFRCLALAYDALKAGGTMPAVLNAANEIAVGYFLTQRIPFKFIAQLNQRVMEAHENVIRPDLKQVIKADKWARQRAELEISGRVTGYSK